jgi:putative endopeptidase
MFISTSTWAGQRAARGQVVGAALFFAAALLPWGGLLAQTQAQTDAGPALDSEPGVDPRIQPGDDFFAYANGDWLRGVTIPAGRSRWSVRNEIDQQTRERIDALMATASAASAQAEERLLANFQAAYRDEAAIEARGLRPAKPLLDRIAALNSKVALVRHLGRSLRADVDPLNWGVYASAHLFGLAVQHGIRGERTHAAYLLQGGLGLPNREHYLSDTDAAKALRLKYRDHIARMLALAGFQPALARADAVLALETAIARSHADEAFSSNERNGDNRWSRADFKARAPGIDWDAFFAAAGLSQQPTIVAWQPGAITGQAALLASQPLAVWKDYLRFHLLDQHAAYLPRAFAEPALAFRELELAGKTQPAPRAQRAQDAAAQALPDALGRLYAQRHFPPEHKARVQAIATNVIAAFTKRVEAASWMSPATRAQALAKLKAVYFGLGYPEKWTDYSGLHLDARDAWGNRQRLADWNYRRALARLGQPVDPAVWVMPPQTVGAVFLPLTNAYNFAAALLQPSKFDPAASDAANYGAIGAIIGHELSHFVDTLGADYDATGALKTWWTHEDKARFEALSSRLAGQFAAYRPLPDLGIDGQRTSGENVADLGGLTAAFDAYRATLGSRASDKALVRQRDRQFFIGFARSWRSLSNEAALRTQLSKDSHAPDRYRIATVRNLDAWYEAFDVRPGQALYLPPEARVRIW